jgi:hypothetical protein
VSDQQLELAPRASIRAIAATQPITRYDAFDNPGAWVVQPDTSIAANGPGATVAAFHEPMTNRDWPDAGLFDGVHVTIDRYGNAEAAKRCGAYLVDGNASRPDSTREQKREWKWFQTFAEAKTWADGVVERMRAHCAGSA